jgi:hypothetical protein
MQKLIISVLVSLVWTVPSPAQVAEQVTKAVAVQSKVSAAPKPEQRQDDGQSTRLTEETLLKRLTSEGLTDVEMIRAFLVRAKDADGNPVYLMFYPDSNSEWQITPLDDDDENSTSSHDPAHQQR